MPDRQVSKEECKVIAGQVYDWLKASYLPIRISTREAMEIMGLCTGAEDDIFESDWRVMFDIDYALHKIIQAEKEYVADKSEFAGMTLGYPFNIPFVFREKKRKRGSSA